VFGLTSAVDIAKVRQLLVECQPATGHPIAEYDALARTLREHVRRREAAALRALVKKQQEAALRGILAKRAARVSTTRFYGEDGTWAQLSPRSAAAAEATHCASPMCSGRRRASPTARTPSTPRRHNPGQPVQTPRTGAEWAAYLTSFATDKTYPRLTWPAFAASLQALPPCWYRGSGLEHNDTWSARSFFLAALHSEQGGSHENANEPYKFSPRETNIHADSTVAVALLAPYFTGTRMAAPTAKIAAEASHARSTVWHSDGLASATLNGSTRSPRRPGPPEASGSSFLPSLSARGSKRA
jgi:hypothetical protein